MDLLFNFRDGPSIDTAHLLIDDKGEVFFAINGTEKQIVGQIFVNGTSGETLLTEETGEGSVSYRLVEEPESSGTSENVTGEGVRD